MRGGAHEGPSYYWLGARSLRESFQGAGRQTYSALFAAGLRRLRSPLSCMSIHAQSSGLRGRNRSASLEAHDMCRLFLRNKTENLFYGFHGFIAVLQQEKEERIRRVPRHVE